MRITEARVLVFLEKSHKYIHNIAHISATLDRSYDTISKCLNVMLAKGYIKKYSSNGKNYYEISAKDFLKEAKEVLEAVR